MLIQTIFYQTKRGGADMFPPRSFLSGKGSKKPLQAVVNILKANEQLRVSSVK